MATHYQNSKYDSVKMMTSSTKPIVLARRSSPRFLFPGLNNCKWCLVVPLISFDR
jgi:hypothetical protein